MKSILTVVGARPQFVKASVVSKAIAETSGLRETIVHTGQHFDQNMSDLFFDEMNIPAPTHRLDINSGPHGEMTGRMMIELEKIITASKPDMVMVYGDTNSTLAGALVAAKLHVPIAHVEAGLRSFNMRMPEEINRILTDHVSDLLLCPTPTAVDNLKKEGFESKASAVHLVGDVMQDSAILFSDLANSITSQVSQSDFFLATVHRAENTDNPTRLNAIVSALNRVHDEIHPVVIPLHPRTKSVLEKTGTALKCEVIEPVGYLEMVQLLKRCTGVLTDSGGLQKEAFFFRKPCVTMRDQTEWVELIEHEVNVLVGADESAIFNAAQTSLTISVTDPDELYGGGKASQRIVASIQQAMVNG